jgi:hypothetical protein
MESTEHDGDVEDYSEGEGESTEPEQGDPVMYYPPAEETGRSDVRRCFTRIFFLCIEESFFQLLVGCKH